MAAVMRTGVSEKGVTEAFAVTEHTFSMARTMAALLIDEPRRGPDEDGAPSTLLGVVDEDTAEPEVRAILDDIRTYERETTGRGEVPLFWRTIALNRRYLEATWNKNRLVMGPGELEVAEKVAVALATAMAVGYRPLIERYTALFLAHDHTPADVLEVVAIADYFHGFNLLSDAMNIESDIHP